MSYHAIAIKVLPESISPNKCDRCTGCDDACSSPAMGIAASLDMDAIAKQAVSEITSRIDWEGVAYQGGKAMESIADAVIHWSPKLLNWSGKYLAKPTGKALLEIGKATGKATGKALLGIGKAVLSLLGKKRASLRSATDLKAIVLDHAEQLLRNAWPNGSDLDDHIDLLQTEDPARLQRILPSLSSADSK